MQTVANWTPLSTGKASWDNTTTHQIYARKKPELCCFCKNRTHPLRNSYRSLSTRSSLLLKFGLSLSGHVKWLSRAKPSCHIRLSKSAGSCLMFAYDNWNAAAERFLKKLSLMTYASHARVITVIIQTNLIHLSIKMTMPHQSGAPFVGERVFQNRGVCGQAFPSFPSPTPFLSAFCSRPIFRASRRQKN